MSNQNRIVASSLSWAAIGLAFGVSGLLVGWLTGISNSPVVSTIIPLVFSLIGAFSYTFILRSKTTENIARRIRRLDLDESTKSKLAGLTDDGSTTSWTRAFWALGVILFSVSCYFGAQIGIADRTANFDDTTDLLKESVFSQKAWKRMSLPIFIISIIG
jgi:hypothetical protein